MPPGRDDVGLPLPGGQWGVLPVLPPDSDKQPRNNAKTAASAAGVRALSAQLIAFYFRAPVKAFFRTRVDYLAYARGVHQATSAAQLAQANAAATTPVGKARLVLQHVWLWMKGTTPGVLTTVIRQEGWSVVPQQILPPLVANVGVGAVLYTSYLQILASMHEESGKAPKRVYPPPDPKHTFAAGFLAGSIQSVVAAPLDAIQARYDHREMMANAVGRQKSMWAFSYNKLREIGMRGIFAGWSLSFLKDSFGSAIFFSTFEYVKAQGYYRYIEWYYGGLSDDIIVKIAEKRPTHRARIQDATDGSGHQVTVIRPHYALEPMFLFLGGLSASLAQQIVLHPLGHLQAKHWDHLEDLDEKAAKIKRPTKDHGDNPRRWRMLRAYYSAYQETLATCKAEAAADKKGLVKWLYRGFWWNTLRQLPSTSAGLIIFELVRRRYGVGNDEVRISTDRYDILLN